MTALAMAPFHAGTVLLVQMSALARVRVWMHMDGWCAHVVELEWDAKGVK